MAAEPVNVDEDGFLKDYRDWTPELATELAALEHIELTPAHWEIIRLLRQFYTEFEISPAMRALVNYTRQHLGEEKGRSIYLLALFPGSPAKIGSRIAGLPKPDNCL